MPGGSASVIDAAPAQDTTPPPMPYHFPATVSASRHSPAAALPPSLPGECPGLHCRRNCPAAVSVCKWPCLRFRHDLGHSSAAVSAWQMNPLRSLPQPLPPLLPPSTGTCADIDTAPAAGRARRFASPRRRCRKNNPYYMEKKFGGLKFMPYICTPEIRKDTCNAQVVKLVDTLL